LSAGALPHTHSGKLTALPRPLAGFKRPTSKGKKGGVGHRGTEKREWKKGERREGRGGKGRRRTP